MRNFLQYYDVNKNFKLLLQNLLLIPENFLIIFKQIFKQIFAFYYNKNYNFK